MDYYATVKYTGDGSTTLYTVPFSVERNAEIIVTINNVVVEPEHIGSGFVLMENAPNEGDDIAIVRRTPVAERLVDFETAARLTEYDLDSANIQLIQALQEVYDIVSSSLTLDYSSNLDAQGHRIINVQAPVNDHDAVTKGWVQNFSESLLHRVMQIRDQLQSLSINMVSIPTGLEGNVTYNTDKGIITFFIPEGEQGPTGPEGAMGPAGPKGPQGDEGPRGPEGPRGIEGARGPEGQKGSRGKVGPLGPVGPAGVQGPKGNQGPRGVQGPIGEQGPIGLTGPQGPQGAKGEDGDTGPRGPVGPEGPKGPNGNMGETPLGLAFGRFSLTDDGFLEVSYVGQNLDNTFHIDDTGMMYVTTAQ